MVPVVWNSKNYNPSTKEVIRSSNYLHTITTLNVEIGNKKKIFL